MKQRIILLFFLSVTLIPLQMSGQFTVYLNTTSNKLLRLDTTMCNPTLVTELIPIVTFIFYNTLDITFAYNVALYVFLGNSIVLIETLTGIMKMVCISEMI